MLNPWSKPSLFLQLPVENPDLLSFIYKNGQSDVEVLSIGTSILPRQFIHKWILDDT
jgi:hypothetical protein